MTTAARRRRAPATVGARMHGCTRWPRPSRAAADRAVDRGARPSRAPGRSGRPEPSPAPAPCGGASVTVTSAVDGLVAHDIYANELSGTEVSADASHDRERLRPRPPRSPPGAPPSAQGGGAAPTLVFHSGCGTSSGCCAQPRRAGSRRRGRAATRSLRSADRCARAAGASRRQLRHVRAGRRRRDEARDALRRRSDWRLRRRPPRGVALRRRFPRAQPKGTTLQRLGSVSYRLVTEVDRAFPERHGDAADARRAAAGLARGGALRSGARGRVSARSRSASRRLAVDLPHHYPGLRHCATVTLYSGALVFVRAGAQQLASSGGAGPGDDPARRGAVELRGPQLARVLVPWRAQVARVWRARAAGDGTARAGHAAGRGVPARIAVAPAAVGDIDHGRALRKRPWRRSSRARLRRPVRERVAACGPSCGSGFAPPAAGTRGRRRASGWRPSARRARPTAGRRRTTGSATCGCRRRPRRPPCGRRRAPPARARRRRRR